MPVPLMTTSDLGVAPGMTLIAWCAISRTARIRLCGSA